jgi:hypothetical protein
MNDFRDASPCEEDPRCLNIQRCVGDHRDDARLSSWHGDLPIGTRGKVRYALARASSRPLANHPRILFHPL